MKETKVLLLSGLFLIVIGYWLISRGAIAVGAIVIVLNSLSSAINITQLMKKETENSFKVSISKDYATLRNEIQKAKQKELNT